MEDRECQSRGVDTADDGLQLRVETTDDGLQLRVDSADEGDSGEAQELREAQQAMPSDNTTPMPSGAERTMHNAGRCRSSG